MIHVSPRFLGRYLPISLANSFVDFKQSGVARAEWYDISEYVEALVGILRGHARHTIIESDEELVGMLIMLILEKCEKVHSEYRFVMEQWIQFNQVIPCVLPASVSLPNPSKAELGKIVFSTFQSVLDLKEAR